MAYAASLPDAVLDGVARQLGGMLETLDPAMVEVPVGLAETFPVWLLNRPNDGETLHELATPTTQWHHQIRTAAGRPVAFARSTHPAADGDDDAAPALVRSDIATRLDDAIAWIDQHVPEPAEVRLLVAPAYQLHAFWLVRDGDSRVVVSDFPEGSLELRPGQIYPEQAFLAALRTAEPITGVRSAEEEAAWSERPAETPLK